MIPELIDIIMGYMDTLPLEMLSITNEYIYSIYIGRIKYEKTIGIIRNKDYFKDLILKKMKKLKLSIKDIDISEPEHTNGIHTYPMSHVPADLDIIPPTVNDRKSNIPIVNNAFLRLKQKFPKWKDSRKPEVLDFMTCLLIYERSLDAIIPIPIKPITPPSDNY